MGEVQKGVQMTLSQFLFLVRSDLHRYHGRRSMGLFAHDFFRNAGFKYSFLMRISAYLKERRLLWPLFIVARFFGHRYTFKYGIEIPYTMRIGSGLFIGHFGGIVVSGFAVIGNNCNISHGVTLGQGNRGPRRGYPVIGHHVYIGPGAKVIGKVHVGDNVAIGANCVVTCDIPDGAVVVGVPGRVISYLGSEGYVEHTDY